MERQKKGQNKAKSIFFLFAAGELFLPSPCKHENWRKYFEISFWITRLCEETFWWNKKKKEREKKNQSWEFWWHYKDLYWKSFADSSCLVAHHPSHYTPLPHAHTGNSGKKSFLFRMLQCEVFFFGVHFISLRWGRESYTRFGSDWKRKFPG